MKFLDYLKKLLEANNSEVDTTGSIEFMWSNTEPNVLAQDYYIGAQLDGNFLTFVFVVPSKNTCQIIKSYEISPMYIGDFTTATNETTEYVDKSWFTFRSGTEKDKLTVFPKFSSSYEVITDRFVLVSDKFTKILEITIPIKIINSIEE